MPETENGTVKSQLKEAGEVLLVRIKELAPQASPDNIGILVNSYRQLVDVARGR